MVPLYTLYAFIVSDGLRLLSGIKKSISLSACNGFMRCEAWREA